MLVLLNGLQGKIKTILDRLTQQRADNLDALTSISTWTSATNTKCPDNAYYTNSLGTQMSQLAIAGSRSVVYISSSTWTCPPFVTKVWITAIGGGGAGGGSLAVGHDPNWGQRGGGGGGGAGALLYRVPFIVVPSTVYTVTIGAGGTGVTGGNGNSGGTTSLVGICSVAGGGGGGVSIQDDTNNYDHGGAGGVGGGVFAGQGGAYGAGVYSRRGTAGASSFKGYWGGAGGGRGGSAAYYFQRAGEVGGNAGYVTVVGPYGNALYGGQGGGGGGGGCTIWGQGGTGTQEGQGTDTTGGSAASTSYGAGGGGAGCDTQYNGVNYPGGSGAGGLMILEWIGS